jgi:hypothetical protein
MKTCLTAFLTVLLIYLSPHAEIAVGDTFVLWARHNDMSGMSGGTVEGTEVLESIISHGDTSFYLFTLLKTQVSFFWESYPLQLPSIPVTSKLTILHKIPSNIVKFSSRFANADWIIGEKSDFLFYPEIQKAAPYWPMPINDTCLRGDNYTVRVSDTTGISWRLDSLYGYMVGTFYRFESRFDTVGQIQSGPFPYDNIMQPSWGIPGPYSSGGSNPFHISFVAMLSTIPPLNGGSIEEGRYRSQITYYRPKISSTVFFPLLEEGRRTTWEPKGIYDLRGREILGLSPLKSSNIFITRKVAASNSKTEYELKFRK